jgi:hypothetical protein
MSRQLRSETVRKLWRSKLLDPNGELSADGRLMMADLAKYSRASLPAVAKDATGRIDPLAVQHIMGMQEVYLRIAAMLSVNDIQTQRLAHMNWPGDEPEETGI